MDIYVQTKSKAKKGFVEAVGNLYIAKLNLQRSKFNTIITLVSGFSKATGMNGATTLLDDETIAIAIDSRLDIEKTLTVLAHEMVHAKQYATGKLKYKIEKKRVVYYWCGKKYLTEYYESPWELQAFSKERILANSVAQILLKDK
jgi:hypothetical protein